MPTDDANYDGAVKLLKERYGNQHRVVNAHNTSLMEIQPASDNTTSLRKLHTLLQVERHLRVLEAAGEDARQNIFMSVVMAKPPESVIFPC